MIIIMNVKGAITAFARNVSIEMEVSILICITKQMQIHQIEDSSIYFKFSNREFCSFRFIVFAFKTIHLYSTYFVLAAFTL